MKNLLLKISILLLCIQMPSIGQTTFMASARKGCDTLTVKFNYNTSLANVNTVKWKFGDGSESSDAVAVHKFTKPGNYNITLVLNNTETTEEPDYIMIGGIPNAEFQSHDTLARGSLYKAFNSVKQEKAISYKYAWNISDGTTASTSNFFHQFDTTGVYTARLIVSDLAGCADTVTKSIVVKKELDVPSVFTPNGDGQNDLLIIEGNGETTNSIQIFSRTGTKVFEVSAKVIVWDGRMFSGEKVRDGIYYYVIESTDSAIKERQSGFFYIYGSY